MRAVRALVILLIVIAIQPAVAQARDDTRCDGGSSAVGISATCDSRLGPDAPSPVPVAGGADPDCRWEPLTFGALRDITFMDPNVQIGDQWRYYPDANGHASREAPDGSVEVGQVRVGCADDNGRIRFVGDPDPVDPDPVRVSIDEATRRIPTPEPAFNPALDVGGVVNLGMWLAVAQTDPVQVTANGRGTSVTTTATLVSTTWDMGDGTELTCEGGGTPIDPDSPAWTSAAEGPCGHTYTSPSGGAPYVITATTTWSVTWVATDGRSGTAPDVVRTNTFRYEVREIQTVGVGS
jgi:hypothetical protein